MSIFRLQQPLGIAPDEVTFANLHDLSLLLIPGILLGIVSLATWSISLRRSRFDIEGSVEVEPEEITEVVVTTRKLTEIPAQTVDRYNMASSLEMENTASTAQTNRYLSFFLGDELFAVSLRNVKEVVESNRLIIKGGRSWRPRKAINLRGSVVPILDLSTHFGEGPIEVNQSTLIVILVLSCGEQRQMIGIMVDAICKILSIAPSSIEPTPGQADIRGSFTIGTMKANNRSITLLDISRGVAMGKFPWSDSASKMLEQGNTPTC
jgi:purine-binding chemotaxis protein CheW